MMKTQAAEHSWKPTLLTIRVQHHPPVRQPTFATPTPSARRKIGIAVDPSKESTYAVLWALQHYIRPGDTVILLHVSPTNVLFGADWGSSFFADGDHDDEVDEFTVVKAAELAKPLQEAHILYQLHLVRDFDVKERLCLEVERLGLSTLIIGSRGVGAVERGNDRMLGSISDYCVNHCVCPVIVVRFVEEKDGSVANSGSVSGAMKGSKEAGTAVMESQADAHLSKDGENKDC